MPRAMAAQRKSRTIYNTRAWRVVRQQAFERDGYRCQIRGPKCKGKATEVDHIIPVNDGGALYDLSNLRSACKTCNVGRANSQKHREGWRRARTRIVLVTGPPAAGKTTYANEQAGPLDVVVDYDAISQALGSQREYGASAARQEMKPEQGVGSRLREMRRSSKAGHLKAVGNETAD